MTRECLTRSACASFCVGALLASPALFAAEDDFELPPLDFRVEASAMYDTNIARSRGPGNVLSDHIYNVNAAASLKPLCVRLKKLLKKDTEKLLY